MTKSNYRLLFLLFLLLSSVSFADSTAVRPLSSPVISYPATTSLSPPSGITNANYMTVVPKLCTNINLAHCPTINNVSPRLLSLSQATMDQDCPQYCRATRTVTVTSGSSWALVTSKDAVCPPGYASVAHFDAEPDLVPASGLVATHPSTMDEYKCLNENGYACTASGSTETIQDANCRLEGTAAGTMVDNTPSTNYVVQLTAVQKNPLCGIFGTGSNFCECYYSFKAVNCLSVGSIVANCKHFIPTTLICARITPVWKTN